MRLRSIGLSVLAPMIPALVAAACGSDVATSGSGDDDGSGSGSGSGGGSGGVTLPMPERGFQIVSPEITIPRGKEQTWCYYFHTPNTDALPIKSWQSHMSTGSHHMILYLTSADQGTPGTVSEDGCGGTSGGGGGQAGALSAGVWTYSSQTVDQTFNLPSNDGTGLPLAQTIPAGQPAYIQMHYLNTTDGDIKVHVELNAVAHAVGVAVRGAAPYVTYNGNINIPAPAGSTASASGDCTVAPALKFFVMSTHNHKQGIHTAVKDGSSMVFESTDWEHPGETSWDATPFFSFSSGKLSYSCDYKNELGTAQPIVAGPSAATNEMCMAIGYFFDPAKSTVKSKFCYNSLVLQ
jgi:hypothetical protein